MKQYKQKHENTLLVQAQNKVIFSNNEGKIILINVMVTSIK